MDYTAQDTEGLFAFANIDTPIKVLQSDGSYSTIYRKGKDTLIGESIGKTATVDGTEIVAVNTPLGEAWVKLANVYFADEENTWKYSVADSAYNEPNNPKVPPKIVSDQTGGTIGAINDLLKKAKETFNNANTRTGTNGNVADNTNADKPSFFASKTFTYILYGLGATVIVVVAYLIFKKKPETPSQMLNEVSPKSDVLNLQWILIPKPERLR